MEHPRRREHSHQHDHHDHAGQRHDNSQFHVSRRQVLMGIGAAGITASTSLGPLASVLRSAPEVSPQAAAASPSLFRIEKVTEGVYAAVAKPAAMINCNATVVVGSDYALVVDTHSKPSAARALIQQIRKEVTDRPVRYVINSHFHWDHAQGNLAYPEAYGPSTDVVASIRTREWLAREGVPRLRQSLESLPKQIADLRKQATASKSQAEQAYLNAQIAEMEAYLKEMNPPEKQIKLPTITFERQLVIHPGGREVHLMFLGRGHTAGDVVLYVPSERVVATGDLLHSLLPYMGDSYPDEWGRTLTELEKFEFDRVAPGHGSVQQGRSVLAFFRGYIEEVNEAVARGVEKGESLQELQKALAPERVRSLSSSDQAGRLTREASALLGPAFNPTNTLKGAVAANVAEVYDYYTKRKKA